MKTSIYHPTVLKFMLQFFDLLTINLVYVLFYFFYFVVFDLQMSTISKSFWLIGNVSYVIVLCCVHVANGSRIISPDTITSFVLRTVLLQVLIFLAILSILRIPTPSLKDLLVFYIVAIGFIILGRYFLDRFINKKPVLQQSYLPRVVLIGCGKNIIDMANVLKYPWNGLELSGVFANSDTSTTLPGVIKLGSIDDALPWLKNNKIDEVYCGLPSMMSDQISPIIDYCENNLIRYFTVPTIQNHLKRGMVKLDVGNLSLIALRKEPLSHLSSRIVKRAFDIMVSATFLTLCYPIVYVVVGLGVKLSSPGPIYFKQKRTGMNGKEFVCLKFRSMVVNNTSDNLQATREDARKTRVGNFIRKTNIDELPQFINVLKGDMSIVGPRPHMLKHTETYSDLINKYMVRHLIKPGITGWSQVRGFRGETQKLSDMERRVRHDIWYVENWTFLLDLGIILRTVANMVIGEKKAY
ncbi:MAG: undecaprenyl-phosphate glucose phosphotransferase [Paludibacteraceae bacterium]